MSDGHEAFRKAVEQFFPGGFTLRDEANAIVAYAFRNGPIEDLHAGKSSELLENSELSRITDEEMKKIMVNACQCVEKLLQEKQKDPGAYYQKIMNYVELLQPPKRYAKHARERSSVRAVEKPNTALQPHLVKRVRRKARKL